MKNILAALALILSFSLSIQAQNFTEKELTGKWKVVNVGITLSGDMAENQKATLDLIKSQFTAAKFIFSADKNFDFAIQQTQMNKAHWKLNNATNSVTVQEWKDKDTNNAVIMKIDLKKEGTKTFFILAGMFAKLEVVKE